MDTIVNLIADKRNLFVKLVYYILALNVASIGFTIIRTADKELSLNQLPYGLSILFWGLSVYLGLTYLGYLDMSMSAIFLN